MAKYGGGRKALPEGEKREVFRVSLQKKNLDALDKIVEELNAQNTFSEINRISIIEALVLQFIKIQEEEKAAK